MRKSFDHLFVAMVEMYERVQRLDDVAVHYGCNRKVVTRALASQGKRPNSRKEAAGHHEHWNSVGLVFEGQLFASFAALAKHLEEPDETGQALRARLLRRGAPLDELTKGHVKRGRDPAYPSPVAKAYALNGEWYSSIVEACRQYHLSRSKVEHRLRRGWTQRQAFGLDPSASRQRNQWKQTELLDGKLLPKTEAGSYKLYEIRNLKDGKFYIGITVRPLEDRFRQHFHVVNLPGRNSPLYNALKKHGKEAFEILLLRDDATNYQELQEQEIAEIESRDARSLGYNVASGGSIGTPKPFKVGNRLFPSHGSAAEAFAIDPRIFTQRLRKYHWTPEQAAEIELPPGGRAHRRIVVACVPYNSRSAAARALGISLAVVTGRLRRGATLEQAFGVEPLPSHFRRIGQVKVGDEVFETMKDAALARNLKPYVVALRLKRGWGVRQALGYDPSPVRKSRKRLQGSIECQEALDLFD